jgi:1-deoxy-D-xylulose-5-phosphate synthase
MHLPTNNILDKIDSPEKLRYLSDGQLRQLAGEIRRLLVETVSQTGGHLASNLGVVELTLALHQVFRSPGDKIVWDVGHQSYTHKLLTGRRDAFATLRQEGGISGFPRASESEHDAFLSGHSSTSLAVADGLAKAMQLQGEKGHVVAVIGDGALTGGMAYESLNNAARERKNLILILNDNKMSIGKNVGSLAGYLAKLRTNRSYFRLKDLTKTALRRIPALGDSVVDAVAGSKGLLKNAVYGASLFEELGFVHLGPVDGHDLPMLRSALERAKSLNRPVFIHVEPVKGKGYAKAEQNPGEYHGLPRRYPDGGQISGKDSFSEVFGRHLADLAAQDERIVAVTAAMKYATGLHHFSKRFQSRFADVGIAEQHAVTYSAGLAAGGMLPVFAVYSTFLQRAYDQILHDCAIEPRHVVLAVDRAGFVGEDGETHQGLYDPAFLTTIPGMAIYAPASYQELRQALERALYHETGVVAVRYPRGSEPDITYQPSEEWQDFTHTPGKDVLFVTYGRQWAEVRAAADLVAAKGIRPGILKLNRIFPIDPAAVDVAGQYNRVVFVEEAAKTGGIGEHFLTALMARGYTGVAELRAVEGFVPQATVSRQLEWFGLDRASLARLLL